MSGGGWDPLPLARTYTGGKKDASRWRSLAQQSCGRIPLPAATRSATDAPRPLYSPSPPTGTRCHPDLSHAAPGAKGSGRSRSLRRRRGGSRRVSPGLPLLRLARRVAARAAEGSGGAPRKELNLQSLFPRSARQRGGMPARCPAPDRCPGSAGGLGRERSPARCCAGKHLSFTWGAERGGERGRGFVKLVPTTNHPQLHLVLVTTSITVCACGGCALAQ